MRPMNPADTLVVGIDGGGTRTRVVAVDGTGVLVGHREVGSINLDDVPWDAARHRLRDALAALRRDTGRDGPFDAGFLGMGGVLAARDRDAMRDLAAQAGLAPDERIGVHHDAFAALEGGLLGAPGIIVVAGTGSISFGRNGDGAEAKCGNWGPALGDEGSGHWLGREALRATAHAYDGRRPETSLARTTLAWLGIDDPDELLGRVHRNDLTRSTIASYAPTVLRLADEGDPVATDIVRDGTRLLATTVRIVHGRLFEAETVEGIIIGGLGGNETYRAAFEQAVHAVAPNLRFVEPSLRPVLGSARLALRQASIVPDANIDRNLLAASDVLPESF